MADTLMISTVLQKANKSITVNRRTISKLFCSWCKENSNFRGQGIGQLQNDRGQYNSGRGQFGGPGCDRDSSYCQALVVVKAIVEAEAEVEAQDKYCKSGKKNEPFP